MTQLGAEGRVQQLDWQWPTAACMGPCRRGLLATCAATPAPASQRTTLPTSPSRAQGRGMRMQSRPPGPPAAAGRSRRAPLKCLGSTCRRNHSRMSVTRCVVAAESWLPCCWPQHAARQPDKPKPLAAGHSPLAHGSMGEVICLHCLPLLLQEGKLGLRQQHLRVAVVLWGGQEGAGHRGHRMCWGTSCTASPSAKAGCMCMTPRCTDQHAGGGG